MRNLYIFLMILFLALITTLAYTQDKNVIDMVKELRERSAPDNNTYQAVAEEIYETMKKNEPMEVTAPTDINIFKKDQERIMGSFNLPKIESFVDNETCADPERLGNYRIFIFISESVPEVTLKRYMRDAKKFDDVLLVMRGMIGGITYVKPTQNFMTKLACGKKLDELKSTTECLVSRLDVNPLLFKLFGVQKVPAIVFSKISYYDLTVKANLNQKISNDDFFIVRGDTSLEYALERFSKANVKEADKYLKILHGSY